MRHADPLLPPAAWLCGWVCLLLLLGVMPAPLLGALACLLLPLLLVWRASVVWSVFKRMRFLLLSLLLLFGWSTPGDALWPTVWSPTREGVQIGALHALRLLIAVWLVRTLWLRYGRDAMLGAFYQLCAPLARIGLPADTLALRLGLTLYHAERLASEPVAGLWRTLHALLQPGMAVAGPDTVQLHLYRWRARDYSFVAACVILTGFLMKVWA